MKKIYCVICGEYRKFEGLKLSYIFKKALVLSIVCRDCKHEDEKKNWDIENSSFNWKYITTLKIWVKSLDWKI